MLQRPVLERRYLKVMAAITVRPTTRPITMATVVPLLVPLLPSSRFAWLGLISGAEVGDWLNGGDGDGGRGKGAGGEGDGESWTRVIAGLVTDVTETPSAAEAPSGAVTMRLVTAFSIEVTLDSSGSMIVWSIRIEAAVITR